MRCSTVSPVFSSEPFTAPPSSNFRLLTEAERHASMVTTFAKRRPDEDVWVFGYGSLIWRPEFDYAEKRRAQLHGYHRALCLWSRVNRGTPERPGLVFGLDNGGSCNGMAYRIPAQDVDESMVALWKREMPSGAYIPKLLSCRTGEGNITALAFTMNRNTEAYVRGLSTDKLVHIIRHAHGSYGPCIEYVLETADALKRYGIVDKRLQDLVSHLRRAMTHAA